MADSPDIFDLLIALLRDGLPVTLQVTGGGIAVAIVAAFLAGLGRVSRNPVLRWTSTTYVEIFRGTSALVQLFWFFYVLPFFGVEISALGAGILVLGLNSGAYGAEVVRGAVQSVARGQREAAVALNFTRLQTLWRIVVPQAIPTMLPPFGNIFIELLKNTALVSLVTLADLTFTGMLIRNDLGRTEEVFFLLLMIYFAIALFITAIMRGLERWVGQGLDRGGAA